MRRLAEVEEAGDKREGIGKKRVSNREPTWKGVGGPAARTFSATDRGYVIVGETLGGSRGPPTRHHHNKNRAKES